jgi:hypothetical protein
MDTHAFLDEACASVNDLGWQFYFVPSTLARGADLGLDAFEFYFLGRGGVLGDVEAPVVASAFGYFNAAVVASMWNAGRAKVAPRDAARAFISAGHEFGRERLSGVDELDAYNAAAAQVLEHARGHAEGLSLFSAVAAEPEPPTSDAAALAMHQLMALREFRGSAHLLAVIATGLEAHVAHFIRRPEMYAMFGWPADSPPTVSDAEAKALGQSDELTNQLVGPSYGVLDAKSADAMIAGLRVIGPLLTGSKIPGTR